MKILVTTEGENLQAQLDVRFGRAKNFLVYSTDTMKWNIVDNQDNQDAGHGAGVSSAQKAVDLGVTAVVSGHFGPKAYEVLSAAKIMMFSTSDCTVEEAIDRHRNGKLPLVTTPKEPQSH
ncbi:NifB/NifX family molybdenum-iron cluster-binding protein [Myxococcota bacterium]|nr:NifB/NifX family molybdenum-iron cluster-binding protein [Myxococcota bacterium]MBU1411313.1 NifB/NifX family molybdenum-iron cluster-binding protein [Myxococcota bacterium]MBU1509136.1 NifB/NifX family molybdenum-iron cluster-binding protein [Myxococcota bacterium]